MKQLKIGEVAPDFQVLDHEGRSIRLSDFRGYKLILFFYPKANTPGCTMEACNLRDHYQDLIEKGFKIIGISADNIKKQVVFAIKNKLPFPLIPDSEKSIINKYGVWGLKKFMGRSFEGIIRTTYIISEEGKIEKVFTKVNTADHSEQILREYKF